MCNCLEICNFLFIEMTLQNVALIYILNPLTIAYNCLHFKFDIII